MKKFFFGALALGTVTCFFSFTDPIPKCNNKYQTNGDQNGDACVNQNCVFKEKVGFFGAQWAECGGGGNPE